MCIYIILLYFFIYYYIIRVIDNVSDICDIKVPVLALFITKDTNNMVFAVK